MQKKITHSLRLISDALDRYKDIACFSSFGKDSVVTMDLCRRVNPNMQIICILTPYKFLLTRQYKDYLTRKWGLNIKTYDRSLITHSNGKKNLYEVSPEECCNYYKVEPTKQAIKEFQLEAWISGLRGTEGHTRKFLDEIEVRDGLVKINPILKWTEADVWLYHSANNIAPNPLYMQGYRSLGCEPCSKPYTTEERSGRWVGTSKAAGECGIHTQSLVDQDKMPKIDVHGKPKREKSGI